jgi:hypothetical protein
VLADTRHNAKCHCATYDRVTTITLGRPHSQLISGSATAVSHSKLNYNHVRPHSAVNTHRYVVCGEGGGRHVLAKHCD